MTRKTDIPNPHAANALSITDGHETVGFLVESDGAFFSFDRDGVLIGEYATQREAAIPTLKGVTPIPTDAGISDGRAVKQYKQYEQ